MTPSAPGWSSCTPARRDKCDAVGLEQPTAHPKHAVKSLPECGRKSACRPAPACGLSSALRWCIREARAVCVPEGRPMIAQRFIAGKAAEKGPKSWKDGREGA